MSAESVATILVSCKQTRFHIESPNYKEVSTMQRVPTHIAFISCNGCQVLLIVFCVLFIRN